MDKNAIKFTKVNADDLSFEPSFFKNEGEPNSRILMHYIWTMFTIEGESEPYFYMRKLCMDGTMSWGGVAKLGKTPLSPQQFSFEDELAQPWNYKNYIPYHETEPGVYETSCEEPYFMHRYEVDRAIYKEGDFLDFEATYWPYCIMARKEGNFYKGIDRIFETGEMVERGCDYLYIPIQVTGTFKGKKINGIGQIDRVYNNGTSERVIGNGYILGSWCTGIREDGKKEMFVAHDIRKNGRGWACHLVEGEEPFIVEDGVYLDCDWKHLPYLDIEKDKTCAFVDCDWYFGGRTAHLHGKWGSKRYCADPTTIKEGYANVFGEFYVGNTPYKHTISQTYCETMVSTIDELEKNGHRVIKD